MNVTIHIGWHKTGSTALQVFLHRNAGELARRYRTYYPSEGLRNAAHHYLAWTFAGRTTTVWGDVPAVEGGGDAYVRDAVDSAKRLGCTSIIFSSESFSDFDAAAVGRLAASVRARADAVRIVAYLRRQDVLAESMYNMDVKWNRRRQTAPFDDYIARIDKPVDYVRRLGGWADAFGRDSLVVRRYRRESLEGRDVRTDFCAATGLRMDGLQAMEAGVNDSLGPRTLEMMRVLNQLEIPDHMHEQIANRLLTYDAKHRSPAAVLFDPGPRREYMAPLERSNRELAAFGVDPAGFAVGDDDRGARNVRPLTPQQFTEIFSYLAGRD